MLLLLNWISSPIRSQATSRSCYFLNKPSKKTCAVPSLRPHKTVESPAGNWPPRWNTNGGVKCRCLISPCADLSELTNKRTRVKGLERFAHAVQGEPGETISNGGHLGRNRKDAVLMMQGSLRRYLNVSEVR